jgi:hypothetical protein
MRALSIASVLLPLSFAALSGCADTDRVRVQSFLPGPAPGTFTYSARTNTVMSANNDGAAEQIRRDWLAETLSAHGMCNSGCVIYQRELVVPPQREALGPSGASPQNPDPNLAFGNTGDVVYTGACL